MNKQALILKLAKEYFDVETLNIRNRDSLDFYDVSIGSIRAALEEAIEAGIREGFLQGQQSILENPKQAPQQPRSTVVYVEAAHTEVTVYGPIGDTYEVVTRNAAYALKLETVYTIPSEEVKNIPFLVTKFAGVRVDVFQAICELLAKL